MVNHYASLLLNLAGENRVEENKSYFTSHNYAPLDLPPALKDFYYLLFPQASSFYYKQFLAYCFFRVLHSANMQENILKYDKRITYDIDSLKEYFRLNRVSVPTTSDPNFTLSLIGKYSASGANNYYFNSYTITQDRNLPEVYVYSDVDKLYLKKEAASPARSENMRIPLEPASSANNSLYRMTKPISIGNTDLSFVIIGDFSDSPGTPGKFTDTSNKYWNFIVESPFTFEFIEFFNKLILKDTTIARMINYGETDSSSLNLYSNHFNEAYRFSGLLNLYIEKVNTLWVRNQM